MEFVNPLTAASKPATSNALHLPKYETTSVEGSRCTKVCAYMCPYALKIYESVNYVRGVRRVVLLRPKKQCEL